MTRDCLCSKAASPEEIGPEAKAARAWIWPLPSFSAKCKNELGYTCTPPVRLHGVHRNTFTDTFTVISFFFLATTTETVVTPPPGSGSTHHNVSTAEGTVTSVPDLKATLIPISAVCGMFILGGAAAWFFRRKFCSYRNKGNKDDMASVPTVVSMDIICCSCCQRHPLRKMKQMKLFKYF